MLPYTRAYSGFAVDDVSKARQFYQDTIGLRVTEEYGMLHLHIGNDTEVLVYPKPGHVPAPFTILNFQVEDIDKAVDELVARGVEFQRYDGMKTDAKGIFRAEGPYIAWFTDPAGNTLSILQER
jgi:predicted enzyme related to lactoylglutathione lyase